MLAVSLGSKTGICSVCFYVKHNTHCSDNFGNSIMIKQLRFSLTAVRRLETYQKCASEHNHGFVTSVHSYQNPFRWAAGPDRV